MPRTIKLTLAYDGTEFAGWQLQPDQRTLQGELELAIERITGRPTRVAASGRTDAGVHALAQVVTFETESAHPADVFQRALNAELPRDMAVLETVEAPSDFHARLDAKRKRYRYAICEGVRDVFMRRYAWHLHRTLDLEAMQQAARALVGRHDFASFQSSGSERETTVRTVYELTAQRISLTTPFGGRAGGEEGKQALPVDPLPPAHWLGARKLLQIEIEADGFLYNMVRNIVGTLVEVGQGKRPVDWVDDVLTARDRRRAGMTAPAPGLYLVRVDY